MAAVGRRTINGRRNKASSAFSTPSMRSIPEFDPLLEALTKYGARCVVYTNAAKRSDAIIDALRRDRIELVFGIDAASFAGGADSGARCVSAGRVPALAVAVAKCGQIGWRLNPTTPDPERKSPPQK